MNKNSLFLFPQILFMLIMVPIAESREFDMTGFHDKTTALANPHKGWYHHFPDNHINKYQIKDDSHLLNFPGMDHIYIRLSWAYLEPQEGKFNWEIIDSIINKWKQHGLGYSFRISCKETSTDRIEQQFATPKWVMQAGAEGGYYRSGETVGDDGPWEPNFDDPVYLDKLDHFLAAFAERYDGAPGLRYIDVGSIGDWGEGHTHSGSRKSYNLEQRKKHIDLYAKYFKKSQLIVTDDFVYGTPDMQERKELHEYVISKGLSYRDDSILVDWYITANSDTYTVRSPEYFDAVYQKTPTVFELEHYSGVKRQGNWIPRPGSSLDKFGKSKLGADYFRGALELLHATYIGYHGDAHDWLNENPELTDELLNKCGYWYFINKIETPDVLRIGQSNKIRILWENKGVAPAYYPYKIMLRLQAVSVETFELDAANLQWLPGQTAMVNYDINLPKSCIPGEYTLKLKLYSPDAKEDIQLALDPKRKDADGFYAIGDVTISN